MGDGGRGDGEEGGTSKGPRNDVRGSCTGSAPIREKNIGGHGRDGDGPGSFLP